MNKAAYFAGVRRALERLGLAKAPGTAIVPYKPSLPVHVPASAAVPSVPPEKGPSYLRRALGGAALGALSGYALSPEDRTGTGVIYGAGLGGAGAALGQALSPLLHDARSTANVAAKKTFPLAGAGLGTLAGIGTSQALIDKNVPDTSENPYRYQ